MKIRFYACICVIAAILLNLRVEAKESDAISIKAIPGNIEQSVKELKARLPQSMLDRLRSAPETITLDYHLSTGMWIRNNWIRPKNSALSKYFVSTQGVSNPDDMSEIILVSLWRDLHAQPLRFEEQTKKAKKFEEETLKSCAVRVKELRVVPEDIWNSLLCADGIPENKLSKFKGRVLLLCLFWKDEHSKEATNWLNTISKKLPKEKAQVIGFFLSTDRGQFQSFAGNKHMQFPVVVDSKGLLGKLRNELVTGVLSVPTILIVDKEGRLVARYNDWDEKSSGKLIADDMRKLSL